MNKHLKNPVQNLKNSPPNSPGLQEKMRENQLTPASRSSEQYFELCQVENFTSDMREKYSEAVDYVNFCHRVMNKLVRKKCSEAGDNQDCLNEFKVPETGNYLVIFDMLLERLASKYLNNFDTKLDEETSKTVKAKNITNGFNGENVGTSKIKPTPCSSRHLEVRGGSKARNVSGVKSTASKINNKETKRLLQNNVKQCNLEQVEHMADSSSTLPDPDVPSFEDLQKDNRNYKKSEVNLDTNDKENKSPKLLISNTDSAEHKCDTYLLNLIQNQIQKFMTSSNGEFEYANKQDDLDLDNFKIANAANVLDIEKYSLENQTAQKSSMTVNNHQRDHLDLCGMSRCHYQNFTCQNDSETSMIQLDQRRLDSTTQFEVITTNFVPKNIQNVFDNRNNVSSTTISLENSTTKTNLQRLADSFGFDQNDDTSSICSDEDVELESLRFDASKSKHDWTSGLVPNKSVEKVINAFKQPSKKSSAQTVQNMSQKIQRKPMSHPLNLNERDMLTLDKDMLSSIGIFGDNGQIRPEVLEFLQEEVVMRKNDRRNKPFRRSRDSSESSIKADAIKVNNINSVLSISADSSSDIKSDSVFHSK